MAFPFGYGLSYTSFAYSNLQAASNGVTLTVTNTGKRAGAEIVQLYVAKPGAKCFRPAQELKGFAKCGPAARRKQDRDHPAGRRGIPLLEHQDRQLGSGRRQL